MEGKRGFKWGPTFRGIERPIGDPGWQALQSTTRVIDFNMKEDFATSIFGEHISSGICEHLHDATLIVNERTRRNVFLDRMGATARCP
jgi:hypothetical protein